MRPVEHVCSDLTAAIDEMCGAGFRLDVIYPAEDPHTAVLANGDTLVRLTTEPNAPRPSGELPPFQPEFVLTRAAGDAAEGRAGMLYRDLIPNRLGGRYIASHIMIPEGGRIADWVHFHRVAFQMICVRKGWVRVVYEDQGDPFVMNAGDMVLQPPEIRHRVLESSPGLEVVEITCPALHETYADHDMMLPNGPADPRRLFAGQRFLRHVAAAAPWTPFNGGEAQETAMQQATAGVAEMRTIRPLGAADIAFAPHHGELVFGFVLDGSGRLEFRGAHAIGPADAFVIPPGQAWAVRGASADFRLLQVLTAGIGEFRLAAPDQSTL